MPVTTTLRVLDAVEELYACREIGSWPVTALGILRRLIPCDLAAFNDFDPAAGRYVAAVLPEIELPDRWDELWPKLGPQNPAYRRLIEDGDVGPIRLSDEISQAELRATELHRLLYAPIGVNYQLATAIEGPEPQVVAFSLSRVRRDFNRRELNVLRLVRAHLRGSYDNARAFSGIARDIDAVAGLVRARGASRAAVDSLTRREGAVLELIALGLSNTQASAALGIGRRTVEKHLERIYAKLGVTNRLAAVARYRVLHARITDEHS